MSMVGPGPGNSSGEVEVSGAGKTRGQDPLHVLMIEAWAAANPHALLLAREIAGRVARVDVITVEDAMDGVFHQADRLRRWVPSFRIRRPGVVKLGRLIVAHARILWFILARRPDVVHVQNLRYPLLEPLFYLFLRPFCPVLALTVHNTQPHEKSAVADGLMLRLARAADVVFVLTDYSRRYLMSKGVGNEGRVIPIPAGAVIPPGHKELPDRAQARLRLGLDETDEVVLAFGLIREYKGYEHLIRAVELAGRGRPRLRLVIAGYAPDKMLAAAYRRLIHDLGLQDRIQFRDERIPWEDVSALFSTADVVALPYTHIDRSGVLTIACQYGCPVLATRVGGLEEFVVEGQTGRLCRPADPADMSQKLEEMFSEPDRLKQMGKEARRTGARMFDWKAAARATVAGYALAGRKS